jgi:hypothetical protein
MNTQTCGINEYLGAVAQKLNAPATTRILTFGTKKSVAGQPMLRDTEGLMTTKTGILDIAQTHFAMTEGRDEFAKRMANFSVGNNQPSTGYEAVANVKTVGAIDLTILARAQSIIPFVAVDRSMKSPVDTLFYMDLVSISNSGDLSVGEVVDGNFQAPNSKLKVDFTRRNTFDAEGKCEVGCELVPGSVKVTIVSSDGKTTIQGRDFNGDGYILFKAGSGITEATVDYDEGTITVEGIPEGATATAHYAVDNQANQEGKETVKVAPKWRNVQLFATEDEIIVQDNLVNRLNMQKIQMLATDGAGATSPADITFARTKNAYLEAMNRKVLRKMVAAVTEPSISYDLSTYSLSNWNVTKNDQITQLMANMEAKFLGQTGVPLTAIITGSFGVAALQVIPNMWTPNPDAAVGLNGLAGYFNGKPVYRHNFLNAYTQTKKVVIGGDIEQVPLAFYGVAKLPDNNSGSMVFGEYLPLTSTGVVSNFAQPVNVSNGFFSMTGATVVADRLVMLVQIIPPVNTFGTEGVGDSL